MTVTKSSWQRIPDDGSCDCERFFFVTLIFYIFILIIIVIIIIIIIVIIIIIIIVIIVRFNIRKLSKCSHCYNV